jgi:hypothetical protein
MGVLEVDNNISLIVGDPRGILSQQLRPHSNYFFIILFINLLYKNISCQNELSTNIIKLFLTCWSREY